MSEIKTILTQTRISVVTTSIEIFTWYDDGLTCILWALLALVSGILNGINYKEGELIIITQPCIDAWVDDNGDIIVSGDTSNDYSINSDGDLIFSY